jgi:hypothetical protein
MIGLEMAEGSIPSEDGILLIIKFVCLLVIGVLVLNGVASTSSIQPGGAFYCLYLSVRRNITYGYSLMGRLLITLVAGLLIKYMDLW